MCYTFGYVLTIEYRWFGLGRETSSSIERGSLTTYFPTSILEASVRIFLNFQSSVVSEFSKMNVIEGEDKLTVYNGLEGRFTCFEEIQEGVIDVEACCDVERNECKFQSKCDEDMQQWHRKLILGVPFKMEEVTETGLRVFVQWTPLSVEKALDKAIDAMTLYDSLKIMNKMKYS